MDGSGNNRFCIFNLEVVDSQMDQNNQADPNHNKRIINVTVCLQERYPDQKPIIKCANAEDVDDESTL